MKFKFCAKGHAAKIQVIVIISIMNFRILCIFEIFGKQKCGLGYNNVFKLLKL